MARHRVAKEGMNTYGRVIEQGALTWADEPIPISWGFDFSDVLKLVGKASDLQRDEDGEITAEVTWTDQHRELMEGEIDKTVFLTISGDQVTRDEEIKNIDLITSCRLRAISAVIDDPWKEA